MVTYNEIKNYFHGRRFYGNTKEAIISRIFNRADILVGEKNIKLSYPKNIFLEDKFLELYLFCYDQRIVKISVEDDKFITTNFFNKDNIEKVILKENYKNDCEKMLEIRFKDNEIFKFNSGNDTNEYYRTELASIIEEICKNIILYKDQNLANGEM